MAQNVEQIEITSFMHCLQEIFPKCSPNDAREFHKVMGVGRDGMKIYQAY